MNASREPGRGLGEREVTTSDGAVVTVRDNPESSRFDAWVGDKHVGTTTYVMGDHEFIVMNTTTEEEWRGRGIGTAMTQVILAGQRPGRADPRALPSSRS